MLLAEVTLLPLLLPIAKPIARFPTIVSMVALTVAVYGGALVAIVCEKAWVFKDC